MTSPSDTIRDDVALSVAEAGRYLSVSPSTLGRWERRGLLKAYRLPGGQRRYFKKDLDAVLTERPKLGRPFEKKESVE